METEVQETPMGAFLRKYHILELLAVLILAIEARLLVGLAHSGWAKSFDVQFFLFIIPTIINIPVHAYFLCSSFLGNVSSRLMGLEVANVFLSPLALITLFLLVIGANCC